MFEQWLLYFLASVSLRCVNPCFRALLYIIIAELSLSNDHYQLSWKEDKFFKKSVGPKKAPVWLFSVSALQRMRSSRDFHNLFICNLFLISDVNHCFLFLLPI